MSEKLTFNGHNVDRFTSTLINASNIRHVMRVFVLLLYGVCADVDSVKVSFITEWNMSICDVFARKLSAWTKLQNSVLTLQLFI